MPFPEIHELFEDDTEALIKFADVLQHELQQAADQLAAALPQNDARTVGDLKHKLRTSLNLLEADTLRTELATATDTLRAGGSVDPNHQQSIVGRLRDYATQLREARW